MSTTQSLKKLFPPGFITKIVLLLGIFLFFLYPATDADLGWHLRYGEYFLNQGQILTENTFAYTMPDYIWTNHSWGFDILIALIFKYFNFVGLTVAGSVLITLSYFLAIRSFSLPLWLGSTLVYLFLGQHLYNTGLRSQHFSLLFTSVVLSLFIQVYKYKRFHYLYSLPLLMVAWSNLHGQFLLGLATIYILALPLLFQKSKNMSHSKLALILLLSTLAPLINPFGVNLINTSIQHLSSPLLQNVFEWMPWEVDTPRMIALLAYMFVCGAIMLKSPSQHLVFKILFFCYSILALKARRIIPFFFLVSFASIGYVLPRTHINRLNAKLPPYMLLLLSFLLLGASFYNLSRRPFLVQSWDTYCQSDVLCSEAAVQFMQSHSLTGKVFNSYRLGGYLVYRYPQVPVFIDGRMTLWQESDGYSPFTEYLTLIHARPGSKELFYQHDFDYIILQPQYALATVLKTQEKWPLIYQDEKVEIFANPKNRTSLIIPGLNESF